MKQAITRLAKDRRGAGLIEYVILVGIVAIVAIAGFTKFGTAVSKKIQAQSQTVDKIKDK
jgi:pilus assembly protein Flp/PilA